MTVIKVCEKDTMAIIKVCAWKYNDNHKSVCKNTMAIIKVCAWKYNGNHKSVWKIQWQS